MAQNYVVGRHRFPRTKGEVWSTADITSLSEMFHVHRQYKLTPDAQDIARMNDMVLENESDFKSLCTLSGNHYKSAQWLMRYITPETQAILLKKHPERMGQVIAKAAGMTVKSKPKLLELLSESVAKQAELAEHLSQQELDFEDLLTKVGETLTRSNGLAKRGATSAETIAWHNEMYDNHIAKLEPKWAMYFKCKFPTVERIEVQP